MRAAAVVLHLVERCEPSTAALGERHARSPCLHRQAAVGKCPLPRTAQREVPLKEHLFFHLGHATWAAHLLARVDLHVQRVARFREVECASEVAEAARVDVLVAHDLLAAGRVDAEHRILGQLAHAPKANHAVHGDGHGVAMLVLEHVVTAQKVHRTLGLQC